MFKTVLKIDGMMCGMCEAHINDTIRKHFEVKKVSSSHSKGTSEIISVEKIDRNELKKAIDETGYILLDYESMPYEKKHFFKK